MFKDFLHGFLAMSCVIAVMVLFLFLSSVFKWSPPNICERPFIIVGALVAASTAFGFLVFLVEISGPQ